MGLPCSEKYETVLCVQVKKCNDVKNVTKVAMRIIRFVIVAVPLRMEQVAPCAAERPAAVSAYVPNLSYWSRLHFLDEMTNVDEKSVSTITLPDIISIGNVAFE